MPSSPSGLLIRGYCSHRGCSAQAAVLVTTPVTCAPAGLGRRFAAAWISSSRRPLPWAGIWRARSRRNFTRRCWKSTAPRRPARLPSGAPPTLPFGGSAGGSPESQRPGVRARWPCRAIDGDVRCHRDTRPEEFLLHGRTADLVNVAGKRSSFGYLNAQLNAIPGVADGVFFLRDGAAGSTGVARSGAVVVAPTSNAAELTEHLRRRIDPVFLPRPLILSSVCRAMPPASCPSMQLQPGRSHTNTT